MAQKLLSRPQMPTAIVTADDLLALGVMAAIQDQAGKLLRFSTDAVRARKVSGPLVIRNRYTDKGKI